MNNSAYQSTTYPQFQTGYMQSAASGNVGFSTYTSSGYTQTQPGYTQAQLAYSTTGQVTQPRPPGDEYTSGWGHQMFSSQSTTAQSGEKNEDLKKEAAIAQEMKQQRATFAKQREEYMRKAKVLTRELDKLHAQKRELLTERSPPRDSPRILRENAKLQNEIQGKLKSIYNAIDMLSSIIGDGMTTERLKAEVTDETETPKKESPQRQASTEPDHRVSESETPQFNYIHYDPELHWCRVCDVFPTTAREYLAHLQSAEHRQVTQDRQLVDTPWHKLPPEPEMPTNKNGPSRRIPIKGLQFFISAPAWYCKLCDFWIGDLHCASTHLKSKNHAHNYANFIEQNPHWETDWIKDREKAFAHFGKRPNSDNGSEFPKDLDLQMSNDKSKKKKYKDKHESPSKDKKKKKKNKKKKKVESSASSSSSSSSSSSDSSSEEEQNDRSKSIRVAMRNKMKMQAQMILKEEITGKWQHLGQNLGHFVEDEHKKKEAEKPKQPPPPPPEPPKEDRLINQWMTVREPKNDHMLENLKGRVKHRHENERRERSRPEPTPEQRRRDREREERELREMKEREKREVEQKIREQKEREKRAMEELERLERERLKRKRETERNERKVADQFKQKEKTPDKYKQNESAARYSPPKKSKLSESEEQRFYESKFDKPPSDSKNGSDKSKSSHSSSKKLPFIGRMPLFKNRKGGPDMDDVKREEYDIRESKFEQGTNVRAFLPEPGVVHNIKLSTPVVAQNYIKYNAENPPPPPQIIPEPPQISGMVPPPPPMIHDMEDPEADHHMDPSMMYSYMGYGMMYPGMYDYSGQDMENIPEAVIRSVDNGSTELPPPPPPPMDDSEDLAMLGIESGDMAAQTL